MVENGQQYFKSKKCLWDFITKLPDPDSHV